MFKHTVKYVNFNNMEVEEDLYFHLSSVEVIRLEAEIGKDIQEYAQELAKGMEIKPLLDFLERVLLSAYGKKTSDGRSFHKSKELRAEFENSRAYAELFEEMLTKPELAQKFGESVADNGKQRKNQVAPQVVNQQ